MEKDNETISILAGEALRLSHDDILMHLRFFDRALSVLRLEEKPGTESFATDGRSCFYDPAWILRRYQKDSAWITRAYLHMLLHCVFAHQFRYDRLDRAVWDLAADLAVENVILELGLSGAALEGDALLARKLEGLKAKAGGLTAERLYRYFDAHSLPGEEEKALRQLFFRDAHSLWTPGERLEMTQKQWEKIGRLAKTELKAFARRKSGTGSLEKNLEEATKERYDYGEILRRFAVPGEEMAVSDEEFDYVYYTYGLSHYGNLPLIEPLEYRESRKVKEFVIAIDTSASCSGSAVGKFLRRTYDILKDAESFFTKINVHIIQCDSQVQQDTRIACQEDLEDFLGKGRLAGGGATDFRPVFAYVEQLREQGEFENLKGLIYFTDGYGVYPERPPEYQVIFAFLEEDENRIPVPPWSMKVVV
ncbi:VWA-like domain-containing protein [uncultured Acetatifactor sp.]|uniref:vWA domain-containing protein n=2 Tax=uncultured Acetatifactor sp. TaxID=1671927 RepID=UPI0026176C63|nr:VWA-like domain-containing protein [uncultured Acetatifactor sp.]